MTSAFKIGDRVHNRTTGKDGTIEEFATWSYGLPRWKVKLQPGQFEVWDEKAMRLIPTPPPPFLQNGTVSLHFCEDCGCHYTAPCRKEKDGQPHRTS